jgi:FKBP-type peptidyl-prolyl cis-trans isomerase FkpA
MKRAMRGVAALVAATLAMMGGNLSAQTVEKSGKAALVTEKDKVSYAVGMDVGRSFQPIGEFIDVAAFERAIGNVFTGGKPLISEAEAKSTDEALRMNLAMKQGAPVPGMPPGTQPPAVAKDKVGLMLGSFAVGPSLAPLKDEIDLPVLIQAVRASLAKTPLLMTEQEAQATMQAYMTKKQSTAGQRNSTRPMMAMITAPVASAVQPASTARDSSRAPIAWPTRTAHADDSPSGTMNASAGAISQ